MNLGKASDDAIQMLKFVDNFIAGSFINGENGYNPVWGSAYYLDMQDPTTGAPLTTWADLYTANGGTSYSMTNLGTWDTSTDGYPAYAAAALAVDITYTGSVKAIEAYGFVVAETARSLAAEGSTSSVSSNPTWAQIPKLPDGVYLTHSQMQIDTTSNDVTLIAQGGDSLLYAGSGNDTLIGGSGTCDLLFGGTGNSTLKAGTGNDYLFGGYGKNTFVDNTGNNYMKGHGTANTFMFDEANSGHDTIANFKTSTDKLQIGANLNGNGIYTAADLINTATVSNGNTVLHLSSKDDITVLGISTPSSLLNTLVIA
jgi:Ca2+-binding RTX toxin-like protein